MGAYNFLAWSDLQMRSCVCHRKYSRNYPLYSLSYEPVAFLFNNYELHVMFLIAFQYPKYEAWRTKNEGKTFFEK